MEQNVQREQAGGHSLLLEGRRRAKLEGVTAVICFNDSEVVLDTALGEIALMGEMLNIEQLNLENGRLDVTGSIEAVEYSDPRPKKEKRGLFSRKKNA